MSNTPNQAATPNANGNANANGAPTNNGRPARRVQGPHSALTDYLASQNINAAQIRQQADARRAAALAALQNGDEAGDDAGDDADEAAPEPEQVPSPAPSRKKKESKAQLAKKEKEMKAIAKIKASRQFKRKQELLGGGDTSDEEAAHKLFREKMCPMPGQMENCEICDKRFTVTAYSRTGDGGGLLCPACTKELNKEEGSAKKKRKTAAGQQRRQMQSNLLDGVYPGAKNLMTLCIETLAKNVDEAEDLGDLPPAMVDRLAAILSKRRLMKSNTLNLFLRPGVDSITIYDAAYMNADDFIRIFQVVPTVKSLRLRNAVHFKNVVVDHLLGTTVELENLSLHGSNLIGDDRWDRFLIEKGSHLRSLKVYYQDGTFGDAQIELLTQTSPNLQRLKISHNQKVTDQGIKHIAKLQNLQYLGIELYQGTAASGPYVEVLNSVGPALRTLSLGRAHSIDDEVLDAIHSNCQNLSKLRISDNHHLTDQGFANLFTDWLNPPLQFVDLHKCRYLDATDPRENPDGIGFGSLGFQALMAHSGKTIQLLKIHSCRHISTEAFEKVFAADKIYPELEKLDISFCTNVNDFVVGSIFRSCPRLKTLAVFGNFAVTQSTKIPKGKILIGMPDALGMRIEGTEDGEGRVI